MSERFSKVFNCKKNLGVENTPIIIRAGVLLVDNQTNNLYAQLKLQNISNKVISLVKVKLDLLDSINRDIGEQVSYDYLDLNCKSEEEFGPKRLIPISNRSARAFSICVTEVAFTDGTVWICDSEAWGTLSDDSNTLKFFNAEFMYHKALRLKKEGTIESIERAIETLSSISEIMDVQDLTEECKKELKLIEFQQSQAKKIELIAGVSIAVIIASIFLVYVIIPNLQG